jgi:hypothetical protein
VLGLVSPTFDCVKPATKVVFPGIALGSTSAAKSELTRKHFDASYYLTFIEISSHPFVVRADQRVVLMDARSMHGEEAQEPSVFSEV